MLPEEAASRYHAGHDPRLAEALVNSREAASIAAIFREVRAAIYAGEHSPGDRLPTRAKLAAAKGVSPESISIVMRMLAAEGIVSSEQGRGTFVLERRRFRVQVDVARSAGTPVPGSSPVLLSAALDAEPAASELQAVERDGALAVSVAIETGGIPVAVSIAVGLVEDALRKDGGWDLAGASVTARPA